MSNKKMVSTARNLDTILKIMEGFMMAFAIVFAVFVVLMKIFKEKMVMGSFSLDLSFVKLYLNDEYNGIPSTILNHMELLLTVGSMGGLVILYVVKVLRSILSPMKEGRPFDMKVAKGLRKLAWVILIGGGVIQAVSTVGSMLLAKNLPMDVIFSSPAIESVEYVFTMDFGFVWMFVVVMLLARIFEYGQQLQLESDETL